jgi:hypothetical protein
VADLPLFEIHIGSSDLSLNLQAGHFQKYSLCLDFIQAISYKKTGAVSVAAKAARTLKERRK